MEQDEGITGQVGESVAGAEERVSEADNSVHGVASESAMKQGLEQGPRPEPSAAASGSIMSEDREALENPAAIATPLEFRSAAAEATPQSASLRPRSRGRKPAVLMRFTAAGDAPGASGVTAAIAHASPPDSYRLVPSRSRKQYSPKRFVAAPPPPAASLGTALPSASGLRTVCCSGVIDGSASTSSSNRPPSRGRKQTRPEHFIPEEAEATTSAKARRSDVVLDRFLSSLVPGSSASDSKLVRNVTAEDAAVRNQRGGERFRIRDASRHAARGIHAALRLSRLGASSASAPGSPPGEPDGRGRFYGVLAVLGASLALSVVSCVLFYVVGQRGDHSGPTIQKQEE